LADLNGGEAAAKERFDERGNLGRIVRKIRRLFQVIDHAAQINGITRLLKEQIAAADYADDLSLFNDRKMVDILFQHQTECGKRRRVGIDGLDGPGHYLRDRRFRSKALCENAATEVTIGDDTRWFARHQDRTCAGGLHCVRRLSNSGRCRHEHRRAFDQVFDRQR
jgi:hypothetical protein